VKHGDTMETDDSGSLSSVDEDDSTSNNLSGVLRAAIGDAADALLMAPSFSSTAASTSNTPSGVLRAADGDAADALLMAPSFSLTAAASTSNTTSVVLRAADGDAVGNLLVTPSFQSWVEDDRNVPPDNQVQYVVMMMTTIDETFSVEVSYRRGAFIIFSRVKIYNSQWMKISSIGSKKDRSFIYRGNLVVKKFLQ
jgi:hypothetical protein